MYKFLTKKQFSFLWAVVIAAVALFVVEIIEQSKIASGEASDISLLEPPKDV